ncbi:hypothetical protein F3Y22_tig00112050pilonHSYRG00008 [Hibiscus syriacus]|uniref:NB-ARC domain-containing protein n=1 Tax=Hibiscus syriacus TaxID=106335 RepID=A0A6A2XVP0_HIBSY|nr:hypothetical protein F3Y22_tig00112050pilonHSYRG00008 [Hibiscus syriacus]
MASSTNQNESDSSGKDTQPLYDEFLKTVVDKNVEPSTLDQLRNFPSTWLGSSRLDHLEKCQSSTCLKRTESENLSNKGTEEEDEDAPSDLSGEEKLPFLKRIYKPVLKRANVYGFDHDEETLKMWLLNEHSHDSFKLLGVIGMLGVGKTALCRLILDEEKVKQRYFPRFLITLSESDEPRSMEKIVERMLEHLGVEDETINSIPEENKLPRLLYALHLRLKGKKFLIVLDDIKQEDVYYEKLASCLRDGHGFPKAYGGAVILNGRHEEPIKKIVGERNVHRVQLLSHQDHCWWTYQSLALGEDGIHMRPQTSDGSDEVRKELMKKCGGLPLAARIMGELKRRQITNPNLQKKFPSNAEKTSGDGEKTSGDAEKTRNN